MMAFGWFIVSGEYQIFYFIFLIRDKRHYQLSVHGQDRKKTMRTKRARGVGQAMSVDGD